MARLGVGVAKYKGPLPLAFGSLQTLPKLLHPTAGPRFLVEKEDMQKKQFFLMAQTLVAMALTQLVVLVGWERLRQLSAPTAAQIPALRFIFAFFVASALLVFLVRKLRQRLVFEIIFALSILTGVWTFFELYTPRFAFLLSVLAVSARYVFPLVLLQNLLMIVGLAGIAIFLGSAIAWPSMIAVLGVLALYDVAAVYGTHHMVTTFKNLLQRGVIFALIIPERPEWIFKRLREVRPGEGFFFLGSGDVALPAIFVASAAQEGLALALGAAVGSLGGLFFTDLLFQWGKKRPMPALPPIAAGTLAGFFVARLAIRLIRPL